MARFLVCCLCWILTCATAFGDKKRETIEFPSEDGTPITADVYWSDASDHGLPFVCLFHQAGFSRGEYVEIAPRLVELGYNCMAVDARSGGVANKVTNKTVSRMVEAGKKKVGNDFIRAYPDIVAALQYARSNYADGKLIAWGSSYSASLVFKADAENEGLIDGILSFAPNDMTEWTRDWIIKSAESVKHPVFITSARRERDKWKRLQETLPEDQVTTFVPVSAGRHGSSALWKSTRENDLYWAEVENFLAEHFSPNSESADANQVAGDTTTTAAANAAATAVATVSTSVSASGPPFAAVPTAAVDPAKSAIAEAPSEPAATETEAGHGHGGHDGHGHGGTEEAETAGHGHGHGGEEGSN